MTIGRSGVWRTVHGSGPRVVIVHGTMDRSTSFGRVVRALEGIEVVRYDRRGYGRSIDLGAPASFAQQVDDLLEVAGPAPVVVVGHSYGGTIALGAAAAQPDRVAGLVVYECPLPWMPWWPSGSAGARAVADAADAEDAAERFMRRMLGDDRWGKLPPSTRRARRAEGPTLVAEMSHLRPPHPPPFDLGAVGCPTIAANGTQAAPHHARAVAAIAENVLDGTHVVVDGAGHGVHLTHPAAFADLVRRMVDRVAARPS